LPCCAVPCPPPRQARRSLTKGATEQVLLENMISPEPDRAVNRYRLRMDQKLALLEEKGIAEDHCKTE